MYTLTCRKENVELHFKEQQGSWWCSSGRDAEMLVFCRRYHPALPSIFRKESSQLPSGVERKHFFHYFFSFYFTFLLKTFLSCNILWSSFSCPNFFLILPIVPPTQLHASFLSHSLDNKQDDQHRMH